MIKKTLSILVGAFAVALVAFAPSAAATTFCVPTYHPACPDNGTNVAQADLQTAMQAQASDGVADVIHIAPGTVTDPNSIEPSGTDELLVEGAGVDETTITSSATGNFFVLNLAFGGNARAITMRDLTVAVPASMNDNQGAAVQQAGDLLENVDIVSFNPGSSGIPSWDGSGGVYRGGEIRGEGSGSIYQAIASSTVTTHLLVEDVTVRDAVSAIANNNTSTVIARQLQIHDTVQSPISASGGTTKIENSIIESPGQHAIYAIANSAKDVSIEADHITAVQGGNAPAVRAEVQGTNTGNADVVVKNSILDGYVAAYARVAPTGNPGGAASVAIDHTNVPVTGAESSVGDGTLDFAATNTDHDPGFDSPGYELAAGSASIDAASPSDGVIVDLLGVARPVDGDGDGVAVSDQGAYEFVPGPSDPSDPNDPNDPTDPNDPKDPVDTEAPDTVKVKGPKGKLRKRSATFRFRSEPGAEFRCALDGAQAKPCTSPLKLKRLKRGRHVLRVAAVDAAGNADPTPATWRFKVVRKRKR